VPEHAVPAHPAEFFGEYVPAQLNELRSSLGEISSPGAVVFDLGSAGAWSLRLVNGAPSVVAGIDADSLVRLTLSEADFPLIVVAGAERLATEAGEGRVLMAARVLALDGERARLLREAPGTVAIKLTSATGEHRLTMTLGPAEPQLEAPDCEIECALEDLWAIQGGSKNPLELLLDGKLRMTGKVELAMALGAALG
jgi:hypothetical protein